MSRVQRAAAAAAAGTRQLLGESDGPRGDADGELPLLDESDEPEGFAAGARQLLGKSASGVLLTVAMSYGKIHPSTQVAIIGILITQQFIRWWKGRKPAQCQLIEGDPKPGGVAYQQQVVRHRNEPYFINYSHPTDTITGIVCMPVNKQTQSPEAEVTEGGINHKHVAIRLTPVKKGEWACDVAICTKPSSAGPVTEDDSEEGGAGGGDGASSQ